MIERMRRLVRATPDWRGLTFLLAIVAAFLGVSFLLHMPHGPQHWTADLVTAYKSTHSATQHNKIALVYVSDKTLDPYPYLSPTHRGLLAELLTAVDAAKPAAIGWDFVIDRKTDPALDQALDDAIQSAQSKLVLGAALMADGAGSAYQRKYLDKANRPIGHLHFGGHHNPLVVSDDVVRHMSGDKGYDPYPNRFASALADQVNVHFHPKSHYISWLLEPEDKSEQFLTLSAEQVLGRAGGPPLPIADMLRDRIVLVGGNFSDRDQHLTPLSVRSHERSPGLFIHAQILAQILDTRTMREAGTVMQVVIVMAAFVFGFWVGRTSSRLPIVIELASVAALVLAAGLAFMWFSFILPYNAIVIAWLAGVAAGHYGKHAHA